MIFSVHRGWSSYASFSISLNALKEVKNMLTLLNQIYLFMAKDNSIGRYDNHLCSFNIMFSST